MRIAIIFVTGCSPKYAAAMLNELMSRLGYARYISQGGDWGAAITDFIVGLYPDRLMGFHSNMFAPPSLTDDLRMLPYIVSFSSVK